jgi:ATP-binding cassette subfamily A (ABC1) protein 3
VNDNRAWDQAVDTTAFKYFVQQSFPGAVLMEEHQGSVTYQLPSGGLSWSAVFRQLEANKERLGIIDYSVSQTTLDQVFINFAKAQHDSLI